MSAKLAIRVMMLAGASIPACWAEGAALAQEQAAASPATDTVDDNTIVVTGTRIRRPELDFPNPITAVTSKEIQQSGRTNLTDYLTKIPALNGSTTSNATAGSNPDYGNSGLNELDLRHLGTQRTLVLVDGRRHVASEEGTAAVDINAIPTDLVERVDVLTGGASAIYGLSWFSKTDRFLKTQTDGDPDTVVPKYLRYKVKWEHDIQVCYDIDKRFNIYAGVENFTDEKPDFASGTNFPYPAGAVGRYLYVGAKIKPRDYFRAG